MGWLKNTTSVPAHNQSRCFRGVAPRPPPPHKPTTTGSQLDTTFDQIQPQEPARALFTTQPTTTRNPAALALPLDHDNLQPTQAKKQRTFLGRILRRRGGDSGGKADLTAPVAEAVGTGILTLAIAMMSAASGGLSGACCE